MELISEVEEKVLEEFTVVVNHEEQYSIWPTFKEIPLGWEEVGVTGSKDSCLQHIESVWHDIRPLSVRKAEEELRNAMANNKTDPVTA